MYEGKTKKFRDTIHGYIEIEDIIVSNIIDTRTFQRLRYIEQTSMRPLYPAARHDRFIHSLGVYWLGKQAFKYFRMNSQKELSETEKGIMNDKWWDKQGLLFVLACLLHDCMHSPFSHTLESLYVLRKIVLPKKNPYGFDKGSKIAELDYKLFEKCKCDSAFMKDFFVADKGAIEYKGTGAPHEKMSSYCVVTEYAEAINTICKELLEEEISDNDIVFMVRMIIGCTYNEPGVENSIKNCIISMLNSSSIDVDGLDYIVRDAYMSGIDNFNIDYQRLLSSFTIIPVEVFNNVKLENQNLDEIWLKGTKLQVERFKADRLQGKLTIEEFDHTDAKNIKGLNCGVSTEQGVCATRSEYEIEISGIRNGTIHFKETCVIKNGQFTGKVECGRRIISPWHPKVVATNVQEYILGYDKNSLSIIQSTIEARNHEYLWVYAHPKVLYSSHYLQWELMRNSAKYLCCCANNEHFEDKKLCFDCQNCKHYKNNISGEEDFLLYIMGYVTYFEKESVKHGFAKRIFQKLAQNGFVFYRTCDDDLNALFKRIYVENEAREELKSEKLQLDFGEYFSRQHRKSLWKSFIEYDNFLKMCEEDERAKDVIPRFCKKVVSKASIYKNNYAELPEKEAKIFEKYGLRDVIVIKSSVKTKELNPNETFIKFKEQVLRLNDLFDKASRKEKIIKEFYYIFANTQENISFKTLMNLAKELDEG